jgi:hypothetical protein
VPARAAAAFVAAAFVAAVADAAAAAAAAAAFVAAVADAAALCSQVMHLHARSVVWSWRSVVCLQIKELHARLRESEEQRMLVLKAYQAQVAPPRRAPLLPLSY